MESVAPLSELFPQAQSAKNIKNNPDELGQSDFLKLMVAQLENQDPSKPMDNFEFLSQIAQFGTVSGIEGLQQSVTDLSSALFSNQALQAAELVGRDVVTTSNQTTLIEGGDINATIDIPQSATGVTVYVQDSAGRLVHSQALGAKPAGQMAWQWDGVDGDGNTLPAGGYRISAEMQSGDTNKAVPVYAHQQVQSVSLESGGASSLLNLADGRQISMNEVKSIL